MKSENSCLLELKQAIAEDHAVRDAELDAEHDANEK